MPPTDAEETHPQSEPRGTTGSRASDPSVRDRAADAWRAVEPKLREAAVRTRRFLGWAHEEESTGLAAAGVTLLAVLILTVPTYSLLGWPAHTLNSLITQMGDPTCVYDAQGALPTWFCGAYLALFSFAGALLVMAAMFVLRRRVAALVRAAFKRGLPGEARFLVAPTVAAIVFTMGWAGVEFHFFHRDAGFVKDGYVPALVGVLTFAIARYGPMIPPRLPALFDARDALDKRVRFAALLAVPLLLPFLAGFLHPAKVEQLTLAVSILAGFLLLAPANGNLGEGVEAALNRRERTLPRKAPTVSLVLLILVAVLALTPAASALGHCAGDSWLARDPLACEAAHHNSIFLSASGTLGLAAALLGSNIGWVASERGDPTVHRPSSRTTRRPGDGGDATDTPSETPTDGWPTGPDGEPVPADWQGEPMIVSHGDDWVDDDGNLIPAGHVWYVDPDDVGHWLPREEAERIVAEERAAAQEAQDLKDEAHARTFEGYEERKRETARADLERERAADARLRGMWDRVRELGDRLQRRADALRRVEEGEAEQAAAQRALDEGTWQDEAWDGIVRDTDTLVSYETLRQAGILAREGLDRAHEEITDPENWRVIYEGTRDSIRDAILLAAKDPETERRVGEDLAAGARTVAQVGAHVVTHPVDTAVSVLGLDNWAAAMDPDVPVRERAARAVYGAVDATLNFGSGLARGADAATDAARTRNALDDAVRSTDEALEGAREAARTHHGIRVADGVEDFDDARHVLLESNHALYEPKPDGAVWPSKTPRGTDAAGDARDLQRTAEAAEDTDDAARAGARTRDKLDDHKGHADPDEFEARRANELAARERSTARATKFEKMQAKLEEARRSGDPDAIRAAEDRLHQATMEVQRDKGALNRLKKAPDDVKQAFNDSLRGNLYDPVDKEVVRWAQDRFDVGPTKYVGEAEPGLHVYLNEETGERIMLFEPTNPKAGLTVGADRDFVVRVGKKVDGKLVVKDAPSHEVRSVYQDATYRHSRASKYWPDETPDDVMQNLDQMITDAHHREAYGRSPEEFRRIIRHPSRAPPDPGQLRGVVTDKSNHWYNEALRNPDRYEEYMSEGMRQTTKQWDNQIGKRLEALQAQGHDVKPPKLIGPDGKETDLAEVMEMVKNRRKDALGDTPKPGTTNVEIERELARYRLPGRSGEPGRPLTPRLMSQRAGEFWEEMEVLRPRAAPSIGTPSRPPAPPPVGAAVRLASDASESLEAHDQVTPPGVDL